MSEKFPTPNWLFESISAVELYVLLALADKVSTAYEIGLVIPLDSEGVFQVTTQGIRRALDRFLQRGWVRVVENGLRTGRKERFYDLTGMGADQLEYTLKQWSWAVHLGEYRVIRWRKVNDKMREWQDTRINL